MKTFQPAPGSVVRRWHVVDAEGMVLGRLASRVATLLRGKHKPEFSPHMDVGDGVIVINAAKVRLTGRKAQQEKVYWHTGYPGGLKQATLGQLLRTDPERVITEAVWGMLPKTSLGRKMLRRLKVYRGSEHPHRAQKPEMADLRDRRSAVRDQGSDGTET
ncbi:MAG: 50S ribosomal protein L13 [Armatimonadota bacterium]|nr:50S ribosomal protein L13 [Armatimonadota bacterium]MDR7402346.1 50S ribosomal protein L13 [Armatimonadota bacterium]MDR7404291.1 50S ribosomal protein L13 [Armatimonadota bacterium]MDR7437331.1 50S ribosomal protein L13 [Armatimonadota bacterium]MDR7472670.1 50S ribosomal protein L13 [Armatimonadota bacterium]